MNFRYVTSDVVAKRAENFTNKWWICFHNIQRTNYVNKTLSSKKVNNNFLFYFSSRNGLNKIVGDVTLKILNDTSALHCP